MVTTLMTNFAVEDLTLKTQVGAIAARRWGEPDAARCVLLLHGWLDNLESFTELVPLLCRDRTDLQVVAIDFPGHGYSQHHAAGHSYHFVDGVADIAAVLDALGWETVYLGGHSMGGALAALYCAANPQSVVGLTSIEAFGPLTAPESATAEQLGLHLLARRKGGCRLLKYASCDAAIAARTRHGGPSAAIIRSLVERNLTTEGSIFLWRTDTRLRWPSPLRMSEAQVCAALTAITCPVNYIQGEQGMARIHRDARARRHVVATLNWHELPGSHHVHMEQVPACARIIGTHLDRVWPEVPLP